jgi:hypothetical protein
MLTCHLQHCRPTQHGNPNLTHPIADPTAPPSPTKQPPPLRRRTDMPPTDQSTMPVYYKMGKS